MSLRVNRHDVKGTFKNTTNNSQNNMAPLEPKKSTIAGPGCCNIAEAQGKVLKIVFWSMIEVLKEEVSQHFKETYGNTSSGCKGIKYFKTRK